MEYQTVLHVAMTVNGLLDFCDRPDSLPRMICPKDAIFRLFSMAILTSDWAVLLSGFEGSAEHPILTLTVSLMMFTDLTRCSKFTAHYDLCKMLVRRYR